jgi:hypothetical protein
VFAAWAAVAFPLGLRGGVAFPALFAIGLLASQGVIRLSVSKTIVVMTLFFLISAAVAATRVSTSTASFLESLSFVRGIAEVGGSQRPSYEVMKWLATGDAFRLGETYFAPLERLFLRIFPLWDRPPDEFDLRLMNVLVLDRVGPIGFSISAEAYYNFGAFGSAIIGFIAGTITQNMGKSAAAGHSKLIMIGLCFPIFIHIRQDFVTTWASFLHCSFVILFIFIINKFSSEK